MSQLFSVFVLFLAIGVTAYDEPCHNAKLKQTPLCNTTLSSQDRASQFVALLSPNEKIGQLVSFADSIDRLGLPRYQWWSESLHGLRAPCFQGICPTSYPAPIGLAATFNMGLVYEMSNQISDEAHAWHDKAELAMPFGLNVWSPSMNIALDPRWGRVQETPGEDPFLTSMFAYHSVMGLQHGVDDQKYRKLVATLKVFAVYNLEHWKNMDRFHFDAKVSKRDLFQTYLAAFERVVKASDVQSIMCSYNSVNGVPSCANALLLRDLLREAWGFNGFVVSDCDAIDNIYSTHKYAKDHPEAAAMALKAGTDLDCGTTYTNLSTALQRGLVTEADLDVSVTRLFKARVELGIFDDLSRQVYARIPLSVVNAPLHRATARQLGRESIVLLKNVANTLPLAASGLRRLALLGPHIDSTSALLGNYYGGVPHVVSVLEGARQQLTPAVDVVHAKGCEISGDDRSGLAAAEALARTSDAAVVVVGLDATQEREDMDRESLILPGRQRELVERVAAACAHTVLVVVAGGAIDLSWAKANTNVGAIVYAFYPGEEGGAAVADVLFGHYSPSGRLPYTIYPERYTNDFSMFDMDMRAGLGRTYRFYTGDVVYPFGFGLSYTTFGLKFSSPPPTSVLFGPATVTFDVEVENTGSRSSDVSVLAFVESSDRNCPRKQLFAFEKLANLSPHRKHPLQFRFSPLDALCVNDAGERIAPSGIYTIVIGDVHTSSLRHQLLVVD